LRRRDTAGQPDEEEEMMEMEDEGGHEHAEEDHPQQEADFPSFSIGR
jgi:hypothetical protein